MSEGREETVALLALELAEGIGHERLRSLIECFGLARATLVAGDWTEAIGHRSYRRPGRAELDWAGEQWARLVAEGGRCLTAGAADYPDVTEANTRPAAVPLRAGAGRSSGANRGYCRTAQSLGIRCANRRRIGARSRPAGYMRRQRSGLRY